MSISQQLRWSWCSANSIEVDFVQVLGQPHLDKNINGVPRMGLAICEGVLGWSLIMLQLLAF
jgi:hypothetical protein